MSRDRKGSPSVPPSETSEAWFETHASELVDCGRMRYRMLARHCGTRRAVPEGSARRKARPDRKGVHAHVLRKPGLLR